MSRLFKIKSSPYYYYTVGTSPNRIYRSTGTEELSIAKRIKRKWDEEYILNKHKVIIPTITTHKLIDEYYSIIAPIKSKSWRERTSYIIKTYKQILPNINIVDLKKYNISQYVSERYKTVQPATIQKEIRILKNIFDYAVENHYLDQNIASNVQLPKIEAKPNLPFSQTDLEMIFAKATPKDLIYWKLLYYTGMRAGDAGTISKKELQNNFIVKIQEKTKNKVAIPLHKELIKLGNKIVMIAPMRNNRNMSYRRLKKILHQIGRNGNLHTFRHTTSTRLQESGLSTDDIKNILGWKSTAMAATYIHPRMEYISEIINKL